MVRILYLYCLKPYLPKKFYKLRAFMQNNENPKKNSLPPQLDTPEIRKAIEVLKTFRDNEEERKLYESRKKALMEEASLHSAHYNLGLKKGEQIALEKTVKNALSIGLDLETIAQLTRLDIARIEEIRKKILH